MGRFGPAPVQINWEEFERLVSYQCTQEEIADFFGISVDTLDRACLRDRKARLADLWDKKKNLGRVKLKKIQFDLAEQGSAAMAIFLGKHLLGQRDDPDDLDKVITASGLTTEQVIALIQGNAEIAAARAKKTFSEFCEAAGYPKPFDKQIKLKEFLTEEKVPRLILGARGYGKTDYVVILGIAYDLYINGTVPRYLIVTKSRERNAAMLNEIASAAMKNGVVFEKESATSLRVVGTLGKDHSVAAVTIRTTSLRGRHPTCVIMDDPVTEDDTSEATRLLVKKKWNEINKLVSNILVIGQPAHKFDLYAELRGILKKIEMPYGSIPELDCDLDAQRAAGVDEKSIQASYFLKILNEGSIPFDGIQYIDKFPVGESAVAWIDPATEGIDSTALCIFRQYMDSIVVKGFLYKKAWNHCLDEMIPHLAANNVRKLAFECNALGDQPIIMLRDLLKDTGVGVVGQKSTTNKHAKIMNAGAFSHLIKLARDGDSKFNTQVVQYEYGAKHDDAPDSLASGLKWIGLIRG
jgi:hypothetical protein